MDQLIKMTPQALEDGANYLESIKSQMLDLAAQLDSKVQEVSSNWEGLSEQAFMGNYPDHLRVLKEYMPETITMLAQKLSGAAQSMHEADSAIASAFRG